MSNGTKLRILLDCDGVLADFSTAWIEIINRESGRSYTPDHIKSWEVFDSFSHLPNIEHIKKVCHEETAKEGFCAGLQTLPGAKEGVNRLREIADVFVVTSPWHTPYWVCERDRWLREHFGFGRDEIVRTSAKHVVQGDFFVDDRYENALKWAQHNTGTSILWAQPYNERQFRTCTEHVQMIRTNAWGALHSFVSYKKTE